MASSTGVMLAASDLIDAARRNDCEALEEILMKYPSEVDSMFGGVNALQEASKHGCIEAIKTLIRHGADLDSFDTDYSTPLHYAVNGNRAMAIQLLLKNGASLVEKNTKGLTAPQVAFCKSLSECIKEFKSFDPNVVFKPDKVDVIPEPVDVQQASTGLEETAEQEDAIEDDDSEKCIYCYQRPPIVTFRPCKHMYACFECAPAKIVCECGQPVTDRSFDDSEGVLNYIKDTKKLRSECGENTKEIDTLKKRVTELQDMMTCHICYDHNINCVLVECGHLFCVKCVRRRKNERDPDYYTPFKCALCSAVSRYQKIYAKWHTGNERDFYVGSSISDFRHSG